VVDTVLHELGVHDRLVIHAFNKIDAMEPPMADALRERIGNLLPGSVFTSAVEPDGLASLKSALLDAVLASRPVVELRVPISDGRLLAEVYREAEVLDRRSDDGALVLRVRAEPEAVGRLKARGAVAGL
jgi:GTP-binding protein HflX